MSPRSRRERIEERELEQLLRAIASMVLLGLIALIVISVLFFPPRTEATLVLGLAASIIGAMVPLLGVRLTKHLPFTDSEEEEEQE